MGGGGRGAGEINNKFKMMYRIKKNTLLLLPMQYHNTDVLYSTYTRLYCRQTDNKRKNTQMFNM